MRMRTMLHMRAMLHIQAMFKMRAMLHIRAMLHMLAMLHMRAFSCYCFSKTMELFPFCLLTINSGKSIVFYHSDHIKCLLIVTCRPYTVTYGGFSWSLFLETMKLFFSLLAVHCAKRTIIADNIIYTILQNKRMRRCGVPPPTNNFRKTEVTPTNYISSESEFIGESESSKILGKYIFWFRDFMSNFCEVVGF